MNEEALKKFRDGVIDLATECLGDNPSKDDVLQIQSALDRIKTILPFGVAITNVIEKACPGIFTEDTDDQQQ